MRIDTTDLVSLDAFPRRFRGTDPRDNVVPSADLAALCRLSRAKALEIAALTMPDLGSLAWCPRGAIPRPFRAPAKEISAEGHVVAVGACLKELSFDAVTVVPLSQEGVLW